MPTVTSADGTPIGYESAGAGPALVLVDGAMCARSAAPTGRLLHDHFTVYLYDRRGRGDSGDTQPYDARREVEDLQAVIGAAERFAGKAPEPRPGLRSGHIPGAHNLPYAKLIAKDGTLRPAPEVERLFKQAGVDLNKPVVTSCGSGITASVLALALSEIGHRRTSVYDGSWSEWGADQTLPIATS